MKRLFSNTVFTGVDGFVLVALNLLATPVLIKNLGMEGYGAFVFLSTFSIFGLLMCFDLGMEGSLMTYVARFEAADDNRKIQDSLVVSLLFYGMMGLILALVLYYFAGFITSRFIDETGALNRATVLTSISIISINVFVQFLTLPFTAILQGLRRFVITKSLNAVLTAVQYIMIMLAAIYFHRIDIAFMVILGLTLVRLVLLICLVLYKLPHFRPMRWRVHFGILRVLFSYSWILFVSRIIGIIFNQMDKFLIWLYLAVSQMAIYAVVVRPANLIRMLISILNSAIIPEVARLHHNKETARIRTLFINLVRYAYLIILPLLTVTYTYMDNLLSLWVGREFAPYSYMAVVMLSVYLLAPIPAMASTILTGLELIKKTIWISIVASIINIVLSLILLRSMGLVGLLVATLVAEIFIVFPYLAMMMRFLEMRAWEVLRPMLQIIAVAVPFAVLNAGVHATFGRHPIVWIPVVAILTLGHYAVNYEFLLSTEEKVGVFSKLKIHKARAIPEAMHQ